MTDKALSGVKVLEYAHFVSGPYSTKLLADLGAEVIKIEEPGAGDEARRRGPFLNDAPHPERSGLFLYLNTNKLGVTLDVETQTGKNIFKELVKWADVLVEDSPPGVMTRLGLDYETLKGLNAKLVMTSITPFGQTGPYRDYKAYHLNVIHGAGGGYMTPPGSPNFDREPLKGAGLFDDYASGLSAALATVSALYACWDTGLGQHVDVSKQQALMNLDRVEIDQYPLDGKIATRVPGAVWVGGIGFSPCKDGYVIAMAMTDRQWQGIAELMGNPQWAKDERFKDALSREANAEELERLTNQELLKLNKEEIYHGGQARDAITCMVCSIDEVVNSEQLKAQGFFVEIEHPEAGKVSYPSAPYIFSETPWRVERPAPLLGQHNEDVYCQLLGYTRQDLVKMRQAGII